MIQQNKLTEKQFQEFLQDKHAENYIGTDDDMPDNFEKWLVNLDIYEMLEFITAFLSQRDDELIEEMEKMKQDVSEVDIKNPEWCHSMGYNQALEKISNLIKERSKR